MDDMYQYASSAVNSNSPRTRGDGSQGREADDIVLQAFNNFGWGQRFSSLLDTVKKQSGAIVDVTRRDLEEIATLLREDGTPTPTRDMSPSTSSTTTEANAASGSSSSTSTSTSNPQTGFAALRERISALDLNGLLSAQRLPENIDLGQLRNEVVQGTRYAEQYLQKFGSEVIDVLGKAITVVEPEEQERTDGQQQRVFATRKETLLAKMRTDPNTYLQEPKESRILETFTASFSIDDYTEEIAKLLDDYPELRDTMNELVPVQVSYPIFWLRYFYHAWCIEQDEQKRQLIAKGAEEDDDDADFKWDSDDEDNHTAEASTNEPKGKTKQSLDSKSGGGGGGGGSDTDFSNISEPVSTEASLVSPPLKSQADGDDWIKADAKKKPEEEDSDSDWE